MAQQAGGHARVHPLRDPQRRPCMAQLMGREHRDPRMGLVQHPHKRAVHPVFPVVGLIGLSLGTVEDLLRQHGTLPQVHRPGRLTKPLPQLLVRDGDGTPAEFVFQAVALHYQLILLHRVIHHQTLIDVDTLLLQVQILPAKAQQLAAGDPGLQKQHERQPVFPLLCKCVSRVMLLLGEGVLHCRGLTFGTFDAFCQGTLGTKLIVHRRVKDQLQGVAVFLDGLGGVLPGRFVDVLLNMDGPDVVEIHVPEVRDQMQLHRMQIRPAASVGLDVGLFIQFQAGHCPGRKLHSLGLAAASHRHFHLVPDPIGLRPDAEKLRRSGNKDPTGAGGYQLVQFLHAAVDAGF